MPRGAVGGYKVANTLPVKDEDCCGCDPRRVSGLRSLSVLLQQVTPEASNDRLHTCQSSFLMVLAFYIASADDGAEACWLCKVFVNDSPAFGASA